MQRTTTDSGIHCHRHKWFFKKGFRETHEWQVPPSQLERPPPPAKSWFWCWLGCQGLDSRDKIFPSCFACQNAEGDQAFQHECDLAGSPCKPFSGSISEVKSSSRTPQLARKVILSFLSRPLPERKNTQDLPTILSHWSKRTRSFWLNCCSDPKTATSAALEDHTVPASKFFYPVIVIIIHCFSACFWVPRTDPSSKRMESFLSFPA